MGGIQLVSYHFTPIYDTNNYPVSSLEFGTRDKRGNWIPKGPLEIEPFWTGQFGKLGRWLFDYIWPNNALFLAVTLAYWYFALPDWEVMKKISWSWILWLHFVNSAGIFLLFGGIELFFYVKRKQGTHFKYNAKFPSENPSDVCWFKSQNIDNFLRTFFISIPLWTLVEAFTLLCFANGYVLWLSPEGHWLWLAVLIFLTPAIHEIYFYCGHWLLHQGVLYKWIHSVHHNSINSSLWSSMSIHPVESAFFFLEMMWYLLIPSNPFVAIFQVTSTAYSAVVGHIGFDHLEVTDKRGVMTHAYTHYLHHKYFEVNFGADGLVSLDKPRFSSWVETGLE